MKFRYLGDKKDMKAFGYDFSKGATPDVTDENAIKRLSGNNHFEAVDEVQETEIPQPEPEAETPLPEAVDEVQETSETLFHPHDKKGGKK